MRLRTAIGPLLVALVASSTVAFERDLHYQLRFALSLGTCFDWRESHLIASGDWGMDENGSTQAEMNPVERKNKIQWHAFGHRDERFLQLWQRTLDEPDLEYRLVKLGQFLHFLEDWESHAGYGVRLGHARATFSGHDPDSLGNNATRNRRVVQSALDHLLRTCADLGRLDDDVDLALARTMKTLDEEGLLQELFDNSNPAWKKGKAGGFRKLAAEILAANRWTTEQWIAQHVQQDPDKHIPEDFEPGDPERGLPPSLGLTFDSDGNLLDVLESIEQVTAARARAAHDAPDLAVDVRRAKRKKRLWRVHVEVSNEGEESVSNAMIETIVVDAGQESVLALETRGVPVLEPGERVEIGIDLPSAGRAPKDAIFGAWVRAAEDDDSVDDQDWLMSDAIAEDMPDNPIVDDLDDIVGPIEAVSFLDGPKLLMVGDSGCIVLTAVTAEGDSSEKLGRTTIGLAQADGDRVEILRDVPPMWSAVSTGGGLVAGKLVACGRPGPEQCAAWRAVQQPRMVVEISVLDPEVEPVDRVLELGDEVIEMARRTCDRLPR